MCGRYALDENARQLADHFQLVSTPEISARYNIAPGTLVLVVRESGDGRTGELMSWGLVPAWARRKGTRTSYPTPINARAETAPERPMFRHAFRAGRCILPASGFFEWHRPDGGRSEPYYVVPANAPVFAMAGLFEEGDAATPASCCILTTRANDAMAPIHDRMPVMLRPEWYDEWLDPHTPVERLRPLLEPPPARSVRAWRVGTRVNSVRNDSPDIVDPVDAGLDR
ncbi:MAG: hypothetical protein GC151_15320 [Betaproteobacteria bacterium]|nr:hypothetical protein [Betaproteobacteria bacterium]